MSRALSSYLYGQPLLNWTFLPGVWCGAGKSVRIPFHFGEVSSPSQVLIAVFLKCLLKKKVLLWINCYICGEEESCLHLSCTVRVIPGHAEFLCLEHRLVPVGTILSSCLLLGSFLPTKIFVLLFCFRTDIFLISKFC